MTDTSTRQVCFFIFSTFFKFLRISDIPEYDDIVEGELPQFEVSDIKFEQTIEAPLTPTDTATLSGKKLVFFSKPMPPFSLLFSRPCVHQKWHRRRRSRVVSP